jgi:hypothetical protein
MTNEKNEPELSFLSFREDEKKPETTEVPITEATIEDVVEEIKEVAVAEEAATGIGEEDILEGETGGKFGPISIIKHAGWLQTSVAGFAGLLMATGASVGLHVPDIFIPVVAFIGFALGFFAPIDFKTLTIKNEHNLVFAAGVLILTTIAASQTSWWNLAAAAGSTILVTLAMIAIVLFSPSGFKSGGDIKMSMVVAFGLGALNPLLPFIWLIVSMVITAVGLISLKKFKSPIAFALATVIGVPISLWLTALLWHAILGAETGVWGSLFSF